VGRAALASASGSRQRGGGVNASRATVTLIGLLFVTVGFVAFAGRVEGADTEQTRTPTAGGTAEEALPTPEQRGEDAAIRRFQADMVRAVGRAVSQQDYPREAREHGWQGTTTVRLEIGPDGLLKAATVARTSGHAVLDDQALSEVRSVPLPEIPDELRERTFSVEIPFRFTLRTPEAEIRGSLEQDPTGPPDLNNLDPVSRALKRFGFAVANRAGIAASAGDYPLEARKKGWQGLTMVRLRFEPGGLLKDVTVAESSGYSVLDEYAVSKIHAVTLPDIPEELRGRAFNVTVPFRFQLQRRATQEGGVVLPTPRLK
jgi:TonB family protein